MAVRRCTNCGINNSTRAKACATCGAPMTGPKSSIGLPFVFGLVVAVGVVLYALWWVFAMDHAEPEDPAGSAEAACQLAVTDQLKSPSSAEFGQPALTTDRGDGTYEVSGAVDAVNSFGADLRITWKCTATHDLEADSWNAVAELDE